MFSYLPGLFPRPEQGHYMCGSIGTQYPGFSPLVYVCVCRPISYVDVIVTPSIQQYRFRKNNCFDRCVFRARCVSGFIRLATLRRLTPIRFLAIASFGISGVFGLPKKGVSIHVHVSDDDGFPRPYPPHKIQEAGK